MIELSKSFQPEVKASKLVKRFQSYSHLKFYIEIQALQVHNWDKIVLKVPSSHSMGQKMVRRYRVRYTKSRKKTTSFQVLANTLHVRTVAFFGRFLGNGKSFNQNIKIPCLGGFFSRDYQGKTNIINSYLN